jgi:orotidine-5'-phosphate decarboxylase
MDQLLVALDVDSAARALWLADELRGLAGGVKVGSRLFTAEGPAIVRALVERGHRVFLDLKFHDIPNTVRGAVACATRLGADIISVHVSAGREAMKSASEAALEASAGRDETPILAGVTVLTSLGNREATRGAEAVRPGSADAIREEVVKLARLAVESGLTGIITSVAEAGEVRRILGAAVAIITPGIRLSAGVDDHKRAGTARDALIAGADFLVVGRPITRAADPRGEALRFLEEMSRAAAAK